MKVGLQADMVQIQTLTVILNPPYKQMIMKKVLTFLFLAITVHVFSQTDHNGNPVFNSVSTGEETIKDYRLISNYYTLKNNIDNKGSSVYISERPTNEDIINAATNLPSDFFLIMKEQSLLNMVMIINQPSRRFIVINPTTGKQSEFDCSIKGEITENRANEIIKENYDPKAKIDGKKLLFNGKKLKIISNNEIKTHVLALIEKQKLNTGDSSTVKILSKEQLKEIVVTESKEGGKLDFFTEIKGHEMDGIQIKPGLFDTKIGIALYKWGRANFNLGVNTVDDALEFWAEFKGRQPNQREKEYIKLGFNKELEK
jgi:hypothetical protein